VACIPTYTSLLYFFCGEANLKAWWCPSGSRAAGSENTLRSTWSSAWSQRNSEITELPRYSISGVFFTICNSTELRIPLLNRSNETVYTSAGDAHELFKSHFVHKTPKSRSNIKHSTIRSSTSMPSTHLFSKYQPLGEGLCAPWLSPASESLSCGSYSCASSVRHHWLYLSSDYRWH